MIKNLFLFASVVSTMALADILPEPGLATPAYTPPAYIPAPVHTQPTYTPPPVTVSLQAGYFILPATSYYTPLPAMTPQLVYINHNSEFLRYR
jgi:hypothetical protein